MAVMLYRRHNTYHFSVGWGRQAGPRNNLQDCLFEEMCSNRHLAAGVLDGHGLDGYTVAQVCTNVISGLVRGLDTPDHLAELLRGVDLVTADIAHFVNSGTTVAMALLTPGLDTLRLTVANAGDSRVVLSRNGVAERLSVDHTTANDEECQRIEAAGGTIRNGRICGNIPTRGFGDRGAKDYIISTPFIRTVDLTDLDSRTSFVLIASDGFWDLVSDQEAVDFALTTAGYCSCEDYIQLARERQPQDDITIVRLGWWKKEERPQLSSSEEGSEDDGYFPLDHWEDEYYLRFNRDHGQGNWMPVEGEEDHATTDAGKESSARTVTKTTNRSL